MITPFIRRLKSAQIASNVATKQNVFLVPVGKQAVITGVVLRGASASLATIAGTLSLGFNAGANDFTASFAEADLQSLTNSTTYFIKNATGASVTGTAGQNFGVIFSNTALTRTIQIDIFGYLISV